MSRAKIPNLRSFQNGLIPLSRASTRRRYSPILGITSWYQSLLRPRSPHWLIESLTVESRHTLKMFWVLYLYRRVGFLCSSSLFTLVRTPDDYSCLFYFQKLHQIFLGSREYSGIVSMFLWQGYCSRCLLFPRSWASGYHFNKHIAAVLNT